MSNTGPQDTNQPSWEENLLDYMFGAMAPDEAARFERGLRECQDHVILAQRYREVIGVLGSVVQPADPPAGHRERFLARLETTEQERPPLVEESEPPLATDTPRLAVVSPPVTREAEEPARVGTGAQERQVIDLAQERVRRQARWATAVASIAAALALLLGIWAYTLYTGRSELNIPPGYSFQTILPQETYTSTAVAVFNPNTQETIFYASNLQPLPAGKVYELWLLQPEGAGTPVPAGTFQGDAAGRATHRHTADRPLREYVGFAVSIEDAPGKLAPEGPIVMAGTYR